jgi:glycosyltransferase involved in cell wall biosynthesis
LINVEIPENLTLVIADAPGLHGIKQRAQQLAYGLSKALKDHNGRLYYFDEPGNIVTVFLSPEKSVSNLWNWIKGPEQDQSGIFHYIPPAGLPFGYHSGPINQWNHFWYRVSLGTRFHRGQGPVVLIVSNVLGLGWLGRLGEDITIYDCADEISEFKQAKLKQGAVQAQERELISRVDAVVTTSKALYDSKSPHAKKIELIRNAAEVDHFNKALKPGPKPSDIADLKKPIVGFYGFLADWLDWPLIERVVTDGVEFDWVFIGPTTRDLSNLTRLDNFHYLGRKPYEMLPDYLRHFACGHIPFALTPLTLNVNPVKLYEYLAGGVPVVATPLPEIKEFSDVCSIASTPEDYLTAIRREISEDSQDKRLLRTKRVEGETWDKRVERYVELISSLLLSA